MEQKSDFLIEPALVSRLRAYYAVLPKGYMDALVRMAMAYSRGNPPNEERGMGYAPGGLVIKDADNCESKLCRSF
ncbi:hypothetical protein FACS189483_07270 [Spirochaetia bacterium]|nr:hypothetical protein FACS189483_07270 [Spirochaetia bacterium]